MSRGWRFRAWPEAEFAELIDLRDATGDEERRALTPGRARWVLRSMGPEVFETGGRPPPRLRALVEDAAGVGRLTPLRDGDLFGLLETEVQRGRLLVVTEARSVPVVPLLHKEEPAPEPMLDEKPDARDDDRKEPDPDFPNPVAQARALRDAAASGVPFCEECERARRARESKGDDDDAGGGGADHAAPTIAA
jgi:hypothetical protein